MIKRGVCKGILVLLMFFAIAPGVFAASAAFTNQNSIFFTGTSSAPGTLYQDAIGSNADVGIELCGFGGSQFVGGVYALDLGASYVYVPITYQSSTDALSPASTNAGGGCFQTSAGFVTISPSSLATPSPNILKAAFPGRLWAGYEASANPGTITNFEYGNASMVLAGSYSLTRSFDQSTRDVSISTPQITFTTDSGSFSKSASDADFGIDSESQMVLGICNDQYGADCNDGEVVSDTSFPKSYSTGLLVGQVNDQNIHTRYAVANGFGYDMCIGANLEISITPATPDPVYYSQNITVDFTISNPRDTPFEQDGGNVDVTTDFNLQVRIYNTSNPSYVPYSNNFSITTDLSPDSGVNTQLVWPAFALSGDYTIEAIADVGDDVTECDEADNTVTDTFELRPVTTPIVLIDGVATNEFPYAFQPYNLTLNLSNSDNTTLSDAYVVISQVNGMSIDAPTQIWNATNSSNATVQRGITHTSVTEFRTDIDGLAQLTYVPTYNKFFTSPYLYLDVETHIGGYNLTFTGNQSNGEAFVFVIDGDLVDDYPFTLGNTTGTLLSKKDLPQETLAAQALEFVYQLYSNFIYTVVD